jgi:hypothetical protein
MKLAVLIACCSPIAGVALAEARLEAPRVTISADRDEVGMGRTVTVSAQATLADGSPALGVELLPYVNGARWGHHAYADSQGRAEFHFPLPNPGLAELLVQVRPAPGSSPERWIWAPVTADQQTVSLQCRFDLESLPESAQLWFAVDDIGKLWLNGELLHEYGGWHNLKPVPVPLASFRTGENLLSAECRNGSGPAGLLLRLELAGAGTETVVASDAHWRSFPEAPAGWPAAVGEGGQTVATFGTPGTGAAVPDRWPGLSHRLSLFAGSLLPGDANTSNRLRITIVRRELEVMPRASAQRVGTQWEPWFTPINAFWQTAEAVPVLGYYQSYNQDVTRQHVIWLVESGVDFWLADWSNHIWFSPTWESRGENCNEIIHATTLALETLASMREEGLPVPQFTLLAGISHVEGGERAVNGMLDWVYHNYLRNPRFKGLWFEHAGKPLVTLLNLGHTYLAAGKVVDPEGRFTIRYVSAQNDKTREHELGLWSWMDTGAPMVTYKDGVAEAVTAAFGYFDSGGWTKPGAAGLRGGATFLETMRVAFAARPQVLFLHQFNEFAGQVEGSGHGENKDQYYDTYNAELTDDYEPTALEVPGYRSPQGGWGYYYLNLQRAVVDLYKQETPETTVLVLEQPRRLAVAGASLPSLK